MSLSLVVKYFVYNTGIHTFSSFNFSTDLDWFQCADFISGVSFCLSHHSFVQQLTSGFTKLYA